MNQANEHDLGPLSWVKGEIDQALAQALQAIDAAASSEGEERSTKLQFAQPHMHQARGALSIIGLDGLTQFTDSVDKLLGDLARGEVALTDDTADLCRRAIAATANYLDELSHGAPDQPLRLAPLHARIALARGEEAANDGDLFFPDLSVRLPRREAPEPLGTAEETRLLRSLRTQFQQGLLAWLRNPESLDSAAQMRDAIAGLESRVEAPSARAFWLAITAFFEVLAEGNVRCTPPVRRLCGRIDAQIRRLMDGSTQFPERLHRDALHVVARAPATSALVRALHQLYHLPALLPPPNASVSEMPLAPLLADLRDQLARGKEAWNQLAEGSTTALPAFEERMSALAVASRKLSRPAFVRLMTTLSAFAQWLRKDPQRLTGTMSMEVASALLLADHALEGGRVPDAAFSAQVEDSISRIEACSRGEDIATQDISPSARQANERNAVSQLCREMQTSLAQVEQTLDAFFRAPEKRDTLNSVRAPIQQIGAILALLDENAAQAVLNECDAMIAQLADTANAVDSALFEPLADQLSALGFYIDSLRRGRPEPQHIGGEAAPAYADSAPPADEIAGGETPAGAPAGETDAAAEPQAASQADEEVATDTPVPIPAPSAESTQLIEASEEQIDAELLDIFIEEAREVLGNIEAQLGASRNAPEDVEALTTLRRGFHTLKGSGRMVGLNALGEVAWSLEQTLNRWLQLDWPASAPLHALIGDAHTLFAAWVEQLGGGGPTTRNDTAPVVAEAQRLLEADSPDGIAETAPDTGTPVQDAAARATEREAEATVEAEGVEAVSFEPEIADDTAPGGEVEAVEDNETEFDLDLDFEPEDEFDLDLDIEDAPEPAEAAEEAHVADAGHALTDATTALGDAPFELPELPDEAQAGAFDEEPLEALGRPEADDEFAGASSGDAAALPPAAELGGAAEPVEPDIMSEAPPSDDESPDATPDAGPERGPAAEETPERAADTATVAEHAEAQAASETVSVGDVDLSRPLYDLYVTEAQQHLRVLREEAAQLNSNPTRVPIEAAVRAAHTLAGISGTSGFDSPQALGRALEHALARLRDTATPAGAEHAALLGTAADTLDAMLGEIANGSLPLPTPMLEAQLASVLRAPAAESAAEVASAAEPAPVTPPLPVASVAEASDDVALDVHDDVDTQLLPIFLEEAHEVLDGLGATLRQWRGDTASTEAPANMARLLHTLKGSARMTGAMTLGEHVHALESQLEATGGVTAALLDTLEQGVDIASQYIDRLARGEALPDMLADSVDTPADAGTAVAIDAEERADTGAATLRVRADLIDRFVNQAGEIGIARTRIEGELRAQRRALLDLTENVIRLRNQLREVEIQADMQMQTRIAQTESEHGSFDPLEMDRYTRLQELTRIMAESVNDVTTVQHALLRNLDGADAAVLAQGRLNRDLQQTLMSVRMRPFDSLADRLYRVVRQSAKDLGKRANLELHGGRIELDRSVLERITSPLEHLLRNAVAHGIESPEARRAADKDEIGEITLSVRHEGNEVVVEMRDDGAGLNYAGIEKRARESGLLGAHETADPRRLTNMIFMPGFSTAGNVSQVSGRGVGMDVVKSETASVGGRIDVSSTPNEGTLFRLYLPLTLAVTQALLVRAAGRVYAIPSNTVAQVLELRPDALASLQAAGGTQWLDKEFPYAYLPRLLGDATTQPEVHRFNWVLLLHSATDTLAVHVDALLGNQEIVVKKAGPQLARLVGYSGASMLGDGQVVLIINPIALAGMHEALGEVQGGLSAADVPHPPVVLVVDDSLTVRKITSRLLDREGFEVITAKDGVDALEQMLETVPDVILSDIEMPRMDGFDLARNIRNDERLKHIPIIMITSRLADKHREYAREIGVEHYLGKPYQEEELLKLIRQHTTETAR